MAPNWDGRERRSERGDHDMITEIHAEVKHINTTMTQQGKDLGTLKTDMVKVQTIQQQSRSNNSQITSLAAVVVAGLALLKTFFK